MTNRKGRSEITPECRKQKKKYRKDQREKIVDVLMFAASMMIALFLFVWLLPRR